MRQQQTTILYLFIILIVLAGLFLFIFKDDASNKLLSYNTLVPAGVNRVSSELNLDILRDSRIKALKSYVSIFDYENMSNSQELILANSGKLNDIIISNPNNEATGTATSTPSMQNLIRVRVGNSNPFLIKKAVK